MLAVRECKMTSAPDDLASSEDALPTLVYDIVRHRGHWRVLHLGKHSSPYANQEDAIAAALEAAKTGYAAGRSVVVRLNRTDGKVLELDLAGETPSTEAAI
jgi:hypothetical protein